MKKITSLVVFCVIFQTAQLSSANNFEEGNNTVVKAKEKPPETELQSKSATSIKLPEFIKPLVQPFAIQLKLDGFLEDMDAYPLSVSTNSWSDLRVKSPPPKGKTVKKGEILLKLDDEQIRRQIEQIHHDLAILQIDRDTLKIELELAKSLAPIQLEEIKRNEKYVKEDLQRFEEEDLPHQKKSMQMSLKRYEDYLLYSKEELNQLKQMYEEDDLTEETEEIILQRAQNDVEYMKFYVENARKNFQDFTNIKAPRSRSAIKDFSEKERLSLSALRKTNPANIQIKQLQLKKMEQEAKYLQKRKKDLEEDLQKMTLRSPADGRIYWGTFERGKWSGPQSFKNKLQKGGVLKPNETFATLCPGKRIRACLNVPEVHLHYLGDPVSGKINFAHDPDLSINSKILSVDDTQHLPGIFGASFFLKIPKSIVSPAPGTACSFTFVAYENSEALTLPAKVVFQDQHSPETDYVYILNKEDKIKKKIIEIGKKSGDILEVVDGISKRDRVLKEKPKD